MSAANAISGHLRAWLQDGTPEDDFVSLAVLSDGSYGISPGIVYSFPIQCKGDGTFNIVQVRSLSLTSRPPVLRALACLHTTLATLAHARTTPTFTLSQLERFLHSCCCHPSPRRRIFSLVLSAHLLFLVLLCDSIIALYFLCDVSTTGPYDLEGDHGGNEVERGRASSGKGRCRRHCWRRLGVRRCCAWVVP